MTWPNLVVSPAGRVASHAEFRQGGKGPWLFLEVTGSLLSSMVLSSGSGADW